MTPVPPAESEAVRRQRDYYARTAGEYDAIQVGGDDEHRVALGWMADIVALRGYRSVLDIGSGTGRALEFLSKRCEAELVAVEPSEALRAIGHAKGLSPQMLRDGDALALPFPDDSFDLVCSYGVLHHIADHRRAVAEMTRVARRAVFISDANNFGQGGRGARLVKQTLRGLRLWRAFDLLRTGFKGYHYSEGDGVFYSYSLFDDLPTIAAKFPQTQFLSTQASGPNFYRSAQSVAVFARRA